jgi:hypothetical protein
MKYNADPIPFEIDGVTYDAKLTPGAIMLMQKETGKNYPTIVDSLIRTSDIVPLDNLLAFCAACLSPSWKAASSDALFDVLELNVLVKFIPGMERLSHLVLEILRDHSPEPAQAEDTPVGDAKNAELPTTPGVGKPSFETSTASSDTGKRRTSSPKTN